MHNEAFGNRKSRTRVQGLRNYDAGAQARTGIPRVAPDDPELAVAPARPGHIAIRIARARAQCDVGEVKMASGLLVENYRFVKLPFRKRDARDLPLPNLFGGEGF